MTPYNSSSNKENCAPLSSNCVIWQGPDIDCINLCNGDSISDVVYRLALEVCAFQGAVGLSSVDLSCLIQVCNNTPAVPATITIPIALNLLASRICCLNDLIDNLPTPGTSNYEEPTLNLATCLRYTNPATGQLVTSLLESQYVTLLGNKLCDLTAVVTTHTTAIANLNTAVTALQNSTGYTPPTVTPKCVLPSVPTAMNTVLTAVETQFCTLVGALGTNPQIGAAAASQCINLSAAPTLSAGGTMSGLPGWNPTVTNLAQSMQNLWITVCDMRSVMNGLLTCCSQADCTRFVLAYTVSTNPGRTAVTLFFNPGTSLPAGYVDCQALGSVVTITDGVGGIFTGRAILATEVSNPSGITYTLPGTFNVSQTYTVTVAGCVKNSGGTQTCEKSTIVISQPPCAIVTGVTASLT
jgi:hypothetical protein